MAKPHASPAQIVRARDLRHAHTQVESQLWHQLRNRRLMGYKFRRQHPVEGYYLDFACEACKLGIELDGSQHAKDTVAGYDKSRTEKLQKSGWQILRFWNNDISQNMPSVLEAILAALTRNQPG